MAELDFPNDQPERKLSSDLAEPYPERGSIICEGRDFITQLRYLKAEGRHVYAVHVKGVAKYQLDFYTPDKNNSQKG